MVKMQDRVDAPDIGFPSSDRKQAELTRMKWLATALLGLATVIFIVASIFEEQLFWVGFVRASAEAAMVGAIADWFAVTALFRHPLGLKIPHTAILPTRKDSFGRSFGQFVQNNFLSVEVISARLQAMNLAQVSARWISQPKNSAAVADFLTVVLQGAVQVVNDDDVQELIEQNLVIRLRSLQMTPLLGSILGLISAGSRQQELLGGAVKLMAHLVEENEAAIRQKIDEETPWWLPKAVEDRIYHKIVVLVENTAAEINETPDHPLHQKFDELLERFVEDLKHSPEVIARGEELKEEFLHDPMVREFSSSLWLDIKTSLLDTERRERSGTRQTIQHGIVKFGLALQKDEALLAKINRWLEEAACYLIEAYGHEAGDFISNTIGEWDAEAASEKIELQVGKDLQFIRINGTIVGGLAGLLIHALSVWLL